VQVYGEVAPEQLAAPIVPAAVDAKLMSLDVGFVPEPAHDNVPVTVNAVNEPTVCVTGDPLVGEVIAAVVAAFCTTMFTDALVDEL
jgi:hypothetical protein